MNDDKTAVNDESQNVGEETNIAPPAESTQVEQTTEVETPVKTDVETTERPTRSEKRIHQLLDKLQDRGPEVPADAQQAQPNTVSDVLGTPNLPWWNGASQLTPGSEVTPEQYEADVSKRAAQVTGWMLAQHDTQNAYKGKIKEYAEDLEKITEAPEFNDKYDKRFDEEFSKLYADLNFNEKGMFVGKVKASEIYKRLNTLKDSARTEGQAETSLSMARLASNGAVMPTAGTSNRTNADAEEVFEKATRSGKPEDWAEVLKGRVKLPQ